MSAICKLCHTSASFTFRTADKDCKTLIGGAEIYKQTIDTADVLEITHVKESVDGDAFFPEIKKDIWNETHREDFENFSFVTYRKK